MNFINSHPPLLFTTTKCWNLISIAPFFSSVQVKFKIHHPHHEHPTKDRNFLSLFWITAQKVVTPLLLLINNFNCLRETICMSLSSVITLSFPPTHHRIQIKSAPWHLSITPHKICSSHSFVFSSVLSTTFVLVHFMNSAQFPPAETPVNYSVWKESHPSIHRLEPGVYTIQNTPPENSLTTRPFFVHAEKHKKYGEKGCYFYVFLF